MGAWIILILLTMMCYGALIKEDEYNGRMMTETLAKSYINNLLNVLSKLEDLQLDTSSTKKYLDYFVDCENCDEID